MEESELKSFLPYPACKVNFPLFVVTAGIIVIVFLEKL